MPYRLCVVCTCVAYYAHMDEPHSPLHSLRLVKADEDVVPGDGRQAPEEVHALIEPLQCVALVVLQAGAHFRAWVHMRLKQWLLPKVLVLATEHEHMTMHMCRYACVYVLSKKCLFAGVHMYMIDTCKSLRIIYGPCLKSRTKDLTRMLCSH